jgi:uncharacterized DUF497 family protein
MRYVWDPEKRRSNIIKQQRWVTLGFLRGLFVVIAHTETPLEIRVISMRAGTKNERAIFFENL